VKSQAHEGWRLLPTQYNDGGFSGGSLNRPALQKLLSDIRDRLVDDVVVFRRSSDGALLLVLMNGTQVQSATIFGQLGLEWTVHGVRDFNGDGKADIVFRRIADGAIFVLLMNGAQVQTPSIIGQLGVEWNSCYVSPVGPSASLNAMK
jgi:hypothetical protein